MRSIHYPIPLPATFDMTAIERRVRERSAVFDAMSGLSMKSFLVRSIAAGHASNAYAPFYIWHNPAEMRSFLSGPIFKGVVDSFGRPDVLDRDVLHHRIVDRAIRPRTATIQTVPYAPDVLPLRILQQESIEHRRAEGSKGLYAAATLLDTGAWVATRFRLWADDRFAPEERDGVCRFIALATTGPDVLQIPALYES